MHPLSQLEFTLAYLGSPLASLLHFPYRDMFDLPRATTLNAVIGAILLMVCAFVAFLVRARIRRGDPSVLLFVACVAFAIGSAVLTSWARAEFNGYGPANANASRYTSASSYLLYGLIYAFSRKWGLSERPARLAVVMDRRPFKCAVACATVLFLVAATRSYSASRSVYANAHTFNGMLAAAFASDDPGAQTLIYPDADAARGMKRTLRRLRLGPYRTVVPSADALPPDPLQALAENKLIDLFGVNGRKDLPVLGRILAAQPPSRYALRAEGIHRVRFEFGVRDRALTLSPPPDGVSFRIVATHRTEETVIWTKTLLPATEPNDRGVHTAEAAIPNDTDEIVFETLAVRSPVNDWAFWRNVSTPP
jgi:hypothetical protein